MVIDFQAIASAVPIETVLADYAGITVQHSRRAVLCPFHAERTPSMSVDKERNFFHCFGCGAGGDPIKFVALIMHCSNAQAARELNDRYGLGLIVDTEHNRHDPFAGLRLRQARAKIAARLAATEAEKKHREYVETTFEDMVTDLNIAIDGMRSDKEVAERMREEMLNECETDGLLRKEQAINDTIPRIIEYVSRRV